MAEPAVKLDPPPEPPVVDPPVGDPPPDPPVTVLDPPAPPEDPPPANWLESRPDDWREQYAVDGEGKPHEGKLKFFQRYADPIASANAHYEADQKIRKGEIEAAKAPDEHSTEEEWATFRTENDIPATAEEYAVKLDDGLVLGEADKEILEAVYPVAHAANLSSGVMSNLTNSLMEAQQKQFHAEEIQQTKWKDEAVAQLKTTWRGDYDTNVNLIQNKIVGALPEAIQEAFEHSVMADGRKMFNTPEVLIEMANWARKLSPSGAVVPNAANPMQAIDTEIAGYEKRMSEDSVAWHKDKAANDRYMQLLNARTEIKKQAAT